MDALICKESFALKLFGPRTCYEVLSWKLNGSWLKSKRLQCGVKTW